MERTANPGQALPDTILLESMGLALMAVDHRCKIIRLNPLAEELTGHQEAEVMGRSCTEVMKASLCDIGCPMQQALRTGTSCQTGMVILQTADRGPLTVEMTASALFGPGNQVVGAVGLLRNLGEEPEQMRIYGSRIFVSRTPAMRRIFDALPQIASSQAPLLILGGRGSGRAAFAETIHNLFNCSTGRSLITIRCSGPHAEQEFAAAKVTPDSSGATLLLEDICEASPILQQRLMAWIEEGKADVYRIISTAKPDLERLIEEGSFSRNLYYRLNVLHLVLPDLKQREDDIPLVVDQLLEEMNLKRRKEVRGLTAGALRYLITTDFPGNIRELRQVIDQAHTRCATGLIEEWHFKGEESSGVNDPRQHDQRMIQDALKMAEGNIGHAAQILRIHRSTLWRRMKRFGIVVKTQD